jgi:hypothetical protein
MLLFPFNELQNGEWLEELDASKKTDGLKRAAIFRAESKGTSCMLFSGESFSDDLLF